MEQLQLAGIAVSDFASSIKGVLSQAINGEISDLGNALSNIPGRSQDIIDRIENREDRVVPSSPGQFIGSYALGTNSFPGGIGLVGERGPELVDLPGGTKIYPNGSFGGINLAYGAVRIYTGPIHTVADEKQLEQKITKTVTRALESAATRL